MLALTILLALYSIAATCFIVKLLNKPVESTTQYNDDAILEHIAEDDPDEEEEEEEEERDYEEDPVLPLRDFTIALTSGSKVTVQAEICRTEDDQISFRMHKGYVKASFPKDKVAYWTATEVEAKEDPTGLTD